MRIPELDFTLTRTDCVFLRNVYSLGRFKKKKKKKLY